VNVVLDSIGGNSLDGNIAALAVDGRLVMIGLMGGSRGELDLAALLIRRLHVIGSTLRARSVADKAAIVAAFLARFGDAIDAGRVRPQVDRVLPLDQAAAAHRIMKASEHFGKIVLRVD
jgi:NADPH:quinone reductase-like Zn-dependent oxidoreductase